MELKDYQQRVLADLAAYLDCIAVTDTPTAAFTRHWTEKGVQIGGLNGLGAYKPFIEAGVPQVCAKVPTAGGKTFIGVHALDVIFTALRKVNPTRPRFVVWLVPSLTILDQTLIAFNDASHPYGRQLRQQFLNRVGVYEKRDLLMGAGFSLDTASEAVSLVVMSFDSLRARNKEDRKIFQENGYLSSFAGVDAKDADWLLPDSDPSALINVIRRLQPVVVVDESHNAESELSVEMLQNLNPAFILDLTATPRKNSNIISYVDAMALKKQHMVKLPVIVANRTTRTEVIESALILRRQLEARAKHQQEEGGKYIRPIILFQAQPKTADDKMTFEDIRDQLVAAKVPREHIAIKTATTNELKGVDLLAMTCPIRYIITVNALKEGWDCPFAYILASLADKNSAVDVEQILGRILRMPYVKEHSDDLLNLSYVFTASAKFSSTLESIVAALNRAGFSERDFRQVDVVVPPLQAGAQALPFGDAVLTPTLAPTPAPTPAPVPGVPAETADIAAISPTWDKDPAPTVDAQASGQPALAPCQAAVAQLTQQALAASQVFEQKAQAADPEVPVELEDKMNRHKMKDVFRTSALAMKLPQFVVKVKTGGFFDDEEAWQLFEHDELLKDFKLASADATIHFEDVDSEMYKVDLEEVGKDNYKASPFKLNAEQRRKIAEHILTLSDVAQAKHLTRHLFGLIGNMYPIADQEVKAYIERIVKALAPEQVRDCLDRDYAYRARIRQKIEGLAAAHAEIEFADRLEVGKITVQPWFALPENITPTSNAPTIAKSLYATESGQLNEFEKRVITDIASLDSVVWWHRNLDRGKGFRLNGFLNHYPDFIVHTKSGKTILVETKGDHLDNTDSAAKLKLGKAWAGAAGNDWKYMMVFDDNPIAGAARLSDALAKLGQM